MGKKLKPVALALAMMVALGLVYQSSITKLTDAGHDWLRRQSAAFCQPGYCLRAEHVWPNEDGQTYYVYIFESKSTLRGLNPGVQILLENSEHEEVDRINLDSPHAMVHSTVLDSIHPSRLEIVFHAPELQPVLRTRLWEIRHGRLIRSEFT